MIAPGPLGLEGTFELGSPGWMSEDASGGRGDPGRGEGGVLGSLLCGILPYKIPAPQGPPKHCQEGLDPAPYTHLHSPPKDG